MAPSVTEIDQVNGNYSPETKISHGFENGVSSTSPEIKGSIAEGFTDSTKFEEEFEYPPMSTPYRILNQYHSKPTKIRVSCIGAGASGLCVIYKMGKMLAPGSWELTVFEKNHSVGGTWFENTYPGVACDTPASLYTYSWDQKHDWSHYYAYGPEIRQYFEDFASKNDCRRFIQFNAKLIEARWDEEKGIWNTVIEDQKSKERRKDWCHVLFNAAGILNNWQWPSIEGLHDFEGPKMHSARWDDKIEYKNKTVGIIGNGSTGIQLVPAIQKDVKHLTVFMRSPTWVAPPWGTSVLEEDIRKGRKIEKGKSQHVFTDEEKQRFEEDPESYLVIRKRLEAEFNSIIQGWVRGTPLAKAMRESITEEMESRIGTGPDSEMLREMLIPKWAPGCRRISPGDGYLEALQLPNVTPVFGAIKRITPTGILTESGEEYKFDILICATGFKPAFRPAFPLYNGTRQKSR